MAFKDLPDHLLFEECRNGNITAYDILFERYYPVLYDFSLRYVKNPAIVEELVMDLMFNIWQKKNELEINGELAAYLFGAMKNTLFNFLRKKELATVPLDSFQVYDCTQSRPTDYDLTGRELENLYHLQLSRLSPQRRKVFVLSREEQMTYPQIAENMNISINTVKSHMLITLKLFRESLKHHVDITALFILCCILLF